MTAYLLAKAITPKGPKAPEVPEPIPAAPAPPPLPPPPTPTEFSAGAAKERTAIRRRRGLQSTVITSPLGLASQPDNTRVGG